jgi:hypothetical protein
MSVPGAGGSTTSTPNFSNDPWNGTGGLPSTGGTATNAVNPWIDFGNLNPSTVAAPTTPTPPTNASVQQPTSISFAQLDPGYASVNYGPNTGTQQGKQDWQQDVAQGDAALQNAAQRGMQVTDIPKLLQGDWTGLQQTGQLGMNANGTDQVLHNGGTPGGAVQSQAANPTEAAQYNAFQQFVNSPSGQQAVQDAGGNAYIAWMRQQSINAGVAPNTGYGSGTTTSSPLGVAANGDYFNGLSNGTQWYNSYGAPIGFTPNGQPQSAVAANYNPFAAYQGLQPSEPNWSANSDNGAAGTTIPQGTPGGSLYGGSQQPNSGGGGGWNSSGAPNLTQPSSGFGGQNQWQKQEQNEGKGPGAYISNITTGGDNTDLGDESWIFPTPPAAFQGDTLAPRLAGPPPPPADFNAVQQVGGNPAGTPPPTSGNLPGWGSPGTLDAPPPGVQNANNFTANFAPTQNIPTFNWQQFLQPNQGLINQYSQMPAQSQQALQAITGIAQNLQGEGQSQFGVGNTAYDQAMQIYSAIAGGNQALASQAIGPQAEQIAQIGQGAATAIQNSAARGGLRQQELAANTQQTAQQVADLIPQLKTTALQQLASGGLAGATAGQAAQAQGAGLQGTVAGAYQQQSQFGDQTALAQELGAGQMGLGATGQQIQEALGQAGINLQQVLGTGALGLQSQAQQFQQGPYFQFLQQQAAQGNQLAQDYLMLQQQGMQGQQNAAKGGAMTSGGMDLAMLAMLA